MTNKIPVMIDPNLLIAAGINPKTGMLYKVGDTACDLQNKIEQLMRVIDQQDAINRFTWINLPEGLNASLIERVLYHKGQGILFWLKDSFYFLPYALSGSIDVYGRYTMVTPLPFNGSVGGKDADDPWIQGLEFKPIYDVQLPEDYADRAEEEIKNYIESSCVILRDYTEMIPQTIIPKTTLNAPILTIMSECFPYMRTALKNSTGVQGMRVDQESDAANVYAANSSITRAVLEGHSKVPIVSSIQFQDLTGGDVARSEEFLMAMQAIDNFRLSTHGLDNGGLFQKRSTKIVAEQEMNKGNVGLIMRDSLRCRQAFCDIVNSIYGLDIWCEPSETAIGMDFTGDGIAGNDEAGQMEDASNVEGGQEDGNL